MVANHILETPDKQEKSKLSYVFPEEIKLYFDDASSLNGRMSLFTINSESAGSVCCFVHLFIRLWGKQCSLGTWKEKKKNQCLGGRFCVAVQFMKCCLYLKNI